GLLQGGGSGGGAEKFHSALLPHAGTDTKVWREVTALSGVLRRAAEVAGTPVAADVALIVDWPARWACDLESHPSGLVRYVDQPLALHRALWNRGVTVDVIGPDADLSFYRLVLVPTLYLVGDATVRALEDFVAAGGHAMITYFSGIVDEDDHIRLGGYPGAFRGLLGIRTEEVFPPAAHER